MQRRYPTITLRIPQDLLDHLKDLAKKSGHTIGWLVREAVVACYGDAEKHPDT